MVNKNIQMTQRNSTNTDWDNLFPITKAKIVYMSDGITNVEDQLTNIDAKITEIKNVAEGIQIPVTSVNNKTGPVILSASDVGAIPTSRKVNNKVLSADITLNSTDIGLGNVTNDAQVKRTERGVANGVATLDSSGVNAQEPKAHTHNYLPLDGGTITGDTSFKKGITVHTANSGGGVVGYMHIAQLVVKRNYANQPILFTILQRGRNQYSELEIYFANANSIDPALGGITKTGNMNAFIHKSAISTWDIYIEKSESYDSIEIADIKKGATIAGGGVDIIFKDTTVTTLPSGNIAASIKIKTINIEGNSTTATKLATPRLIAGKSFDGTADVTITATDVGLGNVSNESKATILNNSPLTGVPTAPTAAVGTNTTQLATTAFVTTAVANKTSVTGNAGTATKLQTARAINGVNFDGSANITIPASGIKYADGKTLEVFKTETNALTANMMTIEDFELGSVTVDEELSSPLRKELGYLNNLKTVDKTNHVSAINEVKDNLDTKMNKTISDDTTTKKYVIGINNGLLYYKEVI